MQTLPIEILQRILEYDGRLYYDRRVKQWITRISKRDTRYALIRTIPRCICYRPENSMHVRLPVHTANGIIRYYLSKQPSMMYGDETIYYHEKTYLTYNYHHNSHTYVNVDNEIFIHNEMYYEFSAYRERVWWNHLHWNTFKQWYLHNNSYYYYNNTDWLTYRFLCERIVCGLPIFVTMFVGRYAYLYRFNFRYEDYIRTCLLIMIYACFGIIYFEMIYGNMDDGMLHHYRDSKLIEITNCTIALSIFALLVC